MPDGGPRPRGTGFSRDKNPAEPRVYGAGVFVVRARHLAALYMSHRAVRPARTGGREVFYNLRFNLAPGLFYSDGGLGRVRRNFSRTIIRTGDIAGKMNSLAAFIPET